MYSQGFGGGELRERQNIASSSSGIAPHLQNSGFDDVNLFDHRTNAGSNYSATYQQDYQQQQQYTQQQQIHTFMNEKFQNGSFLYNKRIVPILFLSMIPVFALAGKYSLFILTMGLIAMYTLDFLEQKAYAFLIFWVSMCLFWASIYTTSISLLFVSVFNIFILLNGSLFVLVLGFWASLQSEWFKTFSHDLVFLAERLVFAGLPIISIPLVISMVVGLVGIGNAPFYLVGVLCVYVHLFGKREVSSFCKTRYIQNPLESRILIALLFLLPPIFHGVVYHNVIFDDFLTSTYSMNAYVALSVLFISSDPAAYLWAFTDASNEISVTQTKKGINLKTESQNSFRYIVQLVSIVLLNIWVEFKVVLPRYHHLIPLSSPWDTIFVFLVLNGLANFILLLIYNQNFVGGNNNSSVSRTALSLFMIGSSFFGGIIIGLPFYLIPLPVIGLYFAAGYLFTRKLYQYFIFVGSVFICAVWFVVHHFWFLNFEFICSFLPFDWSLRMSHATVLMVLFGAASLLTVPFILPDKSDSKNIGSGTNKVDYSLSRNIALVVQVLLLALLEQLLYEQPEGFYSPTLIMLTTGIGIVFSKRLYELKLISIDVVSFLVALYISKMAIMLTQDGVHGTFISAFFTTVAMTRIYFASLTGDSEKMFKESAVCKFYILACGITLYLTRHVLLRTLVTSFIDSRFYDMNEAHLFGFFCLAWGVAILPLSINFMRHSSFVKRFTVFLILIGLVISILQPSVAFFSFSDISSTSLTGTAGIAGDFASLGSISESISDYVPWVVIITVIILFSLDIISLGEKSNPMVRIIFFALVAIGFSISYSGLYLYYTRIWTHVFVLITLVIASLVIYSTHFPINHSYKASLTLFAMFIISLPITYLAITIDEESLKQKNSFLSKEGLHPSTYTFVISELTKSARIAVLGLHCALSALIAILIKFKLIGYPLIRVRKSNKVLNVVTEGNNEFATQTIDPYLSVPGSDELSVVNNGAAVTCFVLCITLTTWLNPDRYEAYLLFCCIFLLLNRDSLYLSEFKDSFRFIFVLLAMEVCMAMFFMIDTILFFSTSATSSTITFDTMISQYSLKFLLLILTLPSHTLFVRFLLRLNKPNLKPILISLPFSILSAVLTVMFSLYLDSFYSLIYITISAVGASILQAMISAQYVREQIILL
ncbi:hypothetical protein NAEGRDRAFT_80771 [Naegleria gruberi]|uniref:Uncharacterized protein n=1 Tax=Naegleria gruberi TaxID=5762 RepID=D2VPL8_NAEGR|nr:uncharacterized protein NAEGRDRAFT_80771 [Naegleria gruberi]EFC41147.1 hypothetical protein NAEGRDRAFT_80771 [Naegleria gruberi]|eukprot:XP_002673891.1 hypothetical protein NAEGRDRAFT_80771 [Naegleria gruberi strain NEG-M]